MNYPYQDISFLLTNSYLLQKISEQNNQNQQNFQNQIPNNQNNQMNYQMLSNNLSTKFIYSTTINI